MCIWASRLFDIMDDFGSGTPACLTCGSTPSFWFMSRFFFYAARGRVCGHSRSLSDG
uniref:Uncharacterized protein n=1 Tax=Picea sitchensis TaxID=3332 RepID=D5A8K8_PICSI|nr:unknown [Picea sitchensis]